MAKKKGDSGAATNIANLGTIITKVTGIGIKYDPGNDDLKIVNLQLVHDNAVVVQKDYSAKEASFHLAINTKQKTFGNAGKLLSPIMKSLLSNKASTYTIDRVRDFINKYRGVVKEAKKEDDEAVSGDNADSTGEGTPERSNRQTSYPFLIQHFEGIYQTLLLEPKYAPKNNEAIKLPALQLVLDSMRTNVKLADEAQDAFYRVRNQQTKLHNDPDTGIFALSGMVKSNLVEDFGISSPEYKSISSLPFKKLYDSTVNKKKKKAAADGGDEEAKKK